MLRNLRIICLLIILISAIAGLLTYKGVLTFKEQTVPVNLPRMPYDGLTLLAHAGGSLPQGLNSNSKEALDLSASQNIKYIELDFSTAKNGDLVLIHDWHTSHYRYFSYIPFLSELYKQENPKQTKNVSTFKRRWMKFGLTQMSLNDLIIWMKKNPDVKIITDIKQDNVTNLKVIYDQAGPLARNIIPQIFAPEEYESVKAIGYTDIIYSNYMTKLENQALVSLMAERDLFALTVPIKTATPSLISAANQADTPVFVHKLSRSTPITLLNTPEGADTLKARGISGIYTDTLYPAKTTSP